MSADEPYANQDTKDLILFLLANMEKEIVFGYSIDRTQKLDREAFEIQDGKVFLNTYEGF